MTGAPLIDHGRRVHRPTLFVPTASGPRLEELASLDAAAARIRTLAGPAPRLTQSVATFAGLDTVPAISVHGAAGWACTFADAWPDAAALRAALAFLERALSRAAA